MKGNRIHNVTIRGGWKQRSAMLGGGKMREFSSDGFNFLNKSIRLRGKQDIDLKNR